MRIDCFVDAEAFSDFQHPRPMEDPDPLWAFNEFSGARLGDQRLTARLQNLTRQLELQPLASIPQACGNWHQSKAAYRFCSHPKVSLKGILQPHAQRTLERVGLSGVSVVLCPQDTTALSHNAHPATQGLGHLGTKAGKSLGLFLDSTLALSASGEFFGLLRGHCWHRPKHKGRSTHQGQAFQEKETFRWLEGWRAVEHLAQEYPWQRWVSLFDREGDIFELFQEATAPTCRAGLVVRARHNRALVRKNGKKGKRRLFKYMRHLPQAGTYKVQVPRHEGQPAREATLSVRWSAVSLAAPRYYEGEAPVSLWAVSAQEINPPAGLKPICWCLLSTVPVRTLKEAIECLQWYVKRWTIEDYHRVLKSGCRAEARQLSTRERLERILAIDMVVAWRIMNLSKAARLEPGAPADRWLSSAQWQALYCYHHHTRQPPQKPPTIAEAVLWIAQLGGFLARKSDGQPGSMTLWRGLQRLNDIVEAWEVFGTGNEPTPRCPKRRGKNNKRYG
ncbi:MAG TPA: IS4 family transposase [Candidatus Sulfotelmatobacter sp.]|nr:IS4 family transposase [Candidatus Sulfotelmatobacter sp.]